MSEEFEGRSFKRGIVSPGIPRRPLIGLGLLVVAFFLIRYLIVLKLDWTWFAVLGYGQVFWRTFWAKLLIGVLIFAAVFFLTFMNIFLVYRVSGKKFQPLLAIAVAIVAAVMIVGNSGQLWLAILKAFNAVPFGVTDPQFNQDIGFYVFKLPFYWLVYRLLNTWLLVNLILTIGLYLFNLPRGVEVTNSNGSVRLFSGLQKRGFTHAGLLLGILIALQALQYRLSGYELLYSQEGSVIGAGAADIGARLPAYYVMMVVSLVLGVYIIITFSRNLKRALLGVGVYFVLSVLIVGILPGLYHRLLVVPEELSKEAPYLEQSIHFTRLAYGLDKLTEVEYPVGDLTAQDLGKNRDIIDNIRLLDTDATKSTYAQQQEIRLYYDFMDVDVDRYNINGKATQVMLSARELNQKSLPEQAQTFNNEIFKYTHGFGLVLSPANSISVTGLPNYLVKDIPPQSTFIPVKEPRIYFGEATSNNVIVNTGLKEFDYPVGDDNQEYLYEGTKGIPMNLLNKIILTIRDMQIKYMLTGYITPQSLYLETRNVRERAARLAPFLIYDKDPYLVLGQDGKLYYFIDAYTVSDKYPYSQAFDKASGINYMRNSVKVTVDAYSGEVNFYVFDEQDPLIQVYRRIYPSLFKPSSEMPRDLKDHARYPEDLFNVQSLMLRDYHMANTTVFYNREDRWEVTQENNSGKQVAQEAYFSIIRLPGENKPEFVLMRAFTPTGKQNMVSWLAGRSDGDNYGRLLLYKFPKGTQIAGSVQVDSLINQDPYISSQMTLWGQGGSRIVRGNLLVYPISGSLLYVEPLYIESEQNKFPQLKKVFVYYKDKIVMEDTLENALIAIFGKSAAAPATPGQISPAPQTGSNGTPGNNQAQTQVQEDVQQLIQRLATLYRSSQEKLKAGDWAGYGQVQKEMENVIKALEEKNK